MHHSPKSASDVPKSRFSWLSNWPRVYKKGGRKSRTGQKILKPFIDFECLHSSLSYITQVDISCDGRIRYKVFICWQVCVSNSPMNISGINSANRLFNQGNVDYWLYVSTKTKVNQFSITQPKGKRERTFHELVS